MNLDTKKTLKNLKNDSFHDFKSFGKDVVKSDEFQKTQAFATNSADILSEKIRLGVDETEERMKEFSEVALRFVKENPFYIAAGVLGLGLAYGAYLLRKRR
ncbi:MAG: hypothetical protein H7Z71_05270 [Moraxellaceae bacterium]|nr:hypothetical protein [Pseudobdellovibrionaceae bacterium]